MSRRASQAVALGVGAAVVLLARFMVPNDGIVAACAIAGMASLPIGIVAMSVARHPTADRMAWCYLMATMSAAAVGECMLRAAVPSGPSVGQRWVVSAVWVVATAVGMASTARFAAGLELRGHLGARLRATVVAAVAVLAVSLHWTLVSWAKHDSLDTPPVAALGIVVACLVAFAAVLHVVRRREVNAANRLLAVGLLFCMLGSAVIPAGVSSSRWASVGYALLGLGHWAWAAAACSPSMPRCGVRAGVPRPQHSHGGAVTAGVALSGVLAWTTTGGPGVVRGAGAIVAVLSTMVCGVWYLLEEARSRRSFATPIDRSVRMLRDDLPGAIAAGEVDLWFQPIVRLSDGALSGAEALLRWQHPELGMIAPFDVLKAAAAGGTGPMLDTWVIERALTLGRSVLGVVAADEPYVGFNVPPEAFRPGFAAEVRRIVERVEVPPDGFVIEITETGSLLGDADARREIELLQDMGFLIAIDDFGAGYANLGHLDEIDVDIVKLDRQLFASSEVSTRGTSIFNAAIGLARSLGTIVMVEGVERAEVAASLLSRGVHYAQGFAFGEPVPLADFCAGALRPTAVPASAVSRRTARTRVVSGRRRRVRARRTNGARLP